ncbi:hypothetical protein BJ684DRAFT_14481 [Piptocephalis cylindrospora]|uniref:Uncharacterized protein n=1 Tax=Piptocephalis cylindrospora TaxID=1907219 RepID=A0A4P9Y823_9FUNG|nr:hypothetical protein BJ684DRAFT_14481 [Piptocephalis cylindrospora]|eukprot:RKP15258.1 hypothetical protein BJ684DRAFT_14481 [Piptocephalis cylindrospora]
MDRLYPTRPSTSPHLPSWMRGYGDVPRFSEPDEPQRRLPSPPYPAEGFRSFRPGQSTRLPDPLELTRGGFDDTVAFPMPLARERSGKRENPLQIPPYTSARPRLPHPKDPWMGEYQPERRYSPIPLSPPAPRTKVNPAAHYAAIPEAHQEGGRFSDKAYHHPIPMANWYGPPTRETFKSPLVGHTSQGHHRPSKPWRVGGRSSYVKWNTSGVIAEKLILRTHTLLRTEAYLERRSMGFLLARREVSGRMWILDRFDAGEPIDIQGQKDRLPRRPAAASAEDVIFEVWRARTQEECKELLLDYYRRSRKELEEGLIKPRAVGIVILAIDQYGETRGAAVRILGTHLSLSALPILIPPIPLSHMHAQDPVGLLYLDSQTGQLTPRDLHAFHENASHPVGIWVMEEVGKDHGTFLGPKAVDALGWWLRQGPGGPKETKEPMALGLLSSHPGRLDLYELSFQATSMPTRPLKATLLPGQEGREVAVRECPLEGELPFLQAFDLAGGDQIPHHLPGSTGSPGRQDDPMMAPPRSPQPKIPIPPGSPQSKTRAAPQLMQEGDAMAHPSWALYEEMARLRLQVQALQHQMDRMEARTNRPW